MVSAQRPWREGVSPARGPGVAHGALHASLSAQVGPEPGIIRHGLSARSLGRKLGLWLDAHRLRKRDASDQRSWVESQETPCPLPLLAQDP